jgi:hypothetical protein
LSREIFSETRKREIRAGLKIYPAEEAGVGAVRHHPVNLFVVHQPEGFWGRGEMIAEG